MMTLFSMARIAIERPERWAKQLVSHLGHKADVKEIEQGSQLTLTVGVGLVSVVDGCVELRAEAPDEESLAKVENVLGGHLDRFAHEHEIRVIWTRG
jgi:hypothetical protein